MQATATITLATMLRMDDGRSSRREWTGQTTDGDPYTMELDAERLTIRTHPEGDPWDLPGPAVVSVPAPEVHGPGPTAARLRSMLPPGVGLMPGVAP
jgi:hypothetical protein